MIGRADIEELRAQAEGERPFRVLALFEKLAAFASEEADYQRLPPEAKLALGYYLAARRRHGQTDGGEAE